MPCTLGMVGEVNGEILMSVGDGKNAAAIRRCGANGDCIAGVLVSRRALPYDPPS